MKKSLLLVLPVLVSCATSDIETTDWVFVQPHDLRDIDYDGVIEVRDQCNDTLIGAKVDNNGCPVQSESAVKDLLDIKFDNDSSKLKPMSYAALERLGIFLQRNPSIVVTIEGHASQVGAKDYNQQLSLRRANAVKRALVDEYAIPETQVEVVAFGASQPVVDNETDKAHQQNRRVVTSFSGSEKTTDMRWTIFTSERSMQ